MVVDTDFDDRAARAAKQKKTESERQKDVKMEES